MSKILAAIRRRYGSPNTISIESIDKPIPKATEVLVEVHATTVNRTDCANLTAKPFVMRLVLGLIRPKKIQLGTDYAGIVQAVGRDVNSVKIGDRVFGFRDTGLETQAQYTAISEKEVFHIPENISFQQAAASLEGAHYAYTFIKKSNIQAGQKILINGSTGGIGSALLQFVRQYDVHITAVGNTKNITLLKSLGADKTYDYRKEDFTKGDEQYDFIFDAVGKSTFGACKALLKVGGVYISSELGPYAQNLFYAYLGTFSNKKVIFPVPYNSSITIPYISDQLRKKQFHPVIDKAYQMHHMREAYAYVMKGLKTGNVVINILPNEQN